MEYYKSHYPLFVGLLELAAAREEDAFDLNLHYCCTDQVNREKYAEHLQDRLFSEKKWEIKQYGWKRAALEWLSGLALDIPFENCAILECAHNCGIELNSEEEEDAFIADYFPSMAMALIRYTENA